MNINNYGTITNRFTGVIGQIIHDEAFICNNDQVTLEQFKMNVVELIKNQYIDLLIFDTSYLKDNNDIPEAIKYLRMHKDKMRIIVIAPNMCDDAFIAQLVKYGVFDIVNPEINEKLQKKEEIDELIKDAVEYFLRNPQTFANMVKYLDIDAKENEEKNNEVDDNTDNKDVKKDKKKSKKLKRAYVIGEKPDSIISALDNFGEYEIVDVKKYDDDISDIKFLRIDHLILINPTIAQLEKMSELVSVIEYNTKIYAGYSDMDNYKKVANRVDINTFVYDNPEEFCRKIAITEHQKKEEVLVINTGSKVITVAGAKGGVGTTTIATLIARHFAKSNLNLKVCVVDFRPFTGTLNIKYRILEPIQNTYRLLKDVINNKKEKYNMDILKGQIINYVDYIKDDNIYVLPTTYVDFYEYSDYQYTNSEINMAYSYIIESLKSTFDIIILDTDQYSSAFDVAVLNSNNVFIVSEFGIESIYRLKAILNRLNPKYYPSIESKLNVVLNKSMKQDREYHVNNQRLLKKFYSGPCFEVPFDKTIINSTESLRPIAANKKVYNAVTEVCNQILKIHK